MGIKEFVDVFPTIVKFRCKFTDLPAVELWCYNMQIEFQFKNVWTNDQGSWASYDIPDEKSRLLFMLRWS